ncbi:response regulator [Promethearchaeum syntrophicum]|uniref:Response regulator n=1 Tax=Promethearchaeum syntrophicum TaxID=2594042 RepID=A0A5B9D8D4_9ARCH|nr:response regulator [Candidatus Prometheoarchaeum syntrophicum]QEE15508.1 osmolarity response regulator [Candidatus Prometheoarchaeum syntrophicum]
MAKAKILVIDDEKVLRESVKKIVEKIGFIAETAMDFPSAKKLVSQFTFDLFLVDIILPKMNGIQLMTKLKEEYGLNGGIIFFTGEPNLDTCIGAIKLGAYDYLEKPVDPSELIEAIKQVLLRRKHDIKILETAPKKEFIIDDSAFLENKKIDDKTLKTLKKVKNSTHKILLDLKKKYGNEFNDEQRDLLNKIVKNNGELKKIIEKLNPK